LADSVIDQKVTGGFGIMLDDIIAGLWAALCFTFIFIF
jgi:phosphatidylglycerophosphatase A